MYNKDIQHMVLKTIGNFVGRGVSKAITAAKNNWGQGRKGPTNTTIANTDGSIDPIDWRVSLSVPPRIKKYAESGGVNNLLAPLLGRTGDRLIFPYTPTFMMGQSAQYNAMSPVQTNYPYYAYENSRVDQITLTADFYVQNQIEAQYWVAVLHYLRVMTKMSYGDGPDKGLPPPIALLNGYGDYVFKDVPVLIQNFTFDLKRDVDYIGTNIKETGTDISADEDSNTIAGVAYAPTESMFTITLQPQYSRSKQAKFNLGEFVRGDKNSKGFI